MRTIRLTTSTLAVACLIWAVAFRGDSPAYADAINSLRSAKSISWNHDFYMRATSVDGQRRWIHKMSSRRMYQHPGKYRVENLNERGDVLSVSIRDVAAGRELTLNPRERTGLLRDIPREPISVGPFQHALDSLTAHPLELIGQRESAAGPANVFRREVSPMLGDEARFLDYWIDAESKELVEFRNSIDAPFDPATDRDAGKPGEKAWKGTRVIGTIEHGIAVDVAIDETKFSLTAPDGYDIEVHQPPRVTEDDFLEFLTTAVEFDGGQFPASPKGLGVDIDKYNDFIQRPRDQWSDVEVKLANLIREAQREGAASPIMQFIDQNAVPDSFRYIGRGVRRGESNRIVCWYRLIASDRHRAIYGDLTVRDVDPQELPLDVGE